VYRGMVMTADVTLPWLQQQNQPNDDERYQMSMLCFLID